MALTQVAGGLIASGQTIISPTLTAPILGTPTSGNLANCTGIPAPAALSTASGSAPSYSARAWVNFKGTGTVSIYGSGNVSSVTDNGTGDFTVNFTTAMQDANYAASGLGEGGSSVDSAVTIEKASGAQSASSMRVFVKQGSTTVDRDYNYLSFFR